MARLIAKLDGLNEQIIELRLGVNRLGRGPANDFQIEHPTISAHHCHISLDNGEVVVSDLESTNGTFFRGEPVKNIRLSAGQSFRMGDVEIFVENTDVKVAIPKFDPPRRPAPPVLLDNGAMLCPRHSKTQAIHRCTHCREIMCDTCVTRLRRRGGKLLQLCPICSHKVEPISQKKKRKNLLTFLQQTVKIPFLHSARSDE